MDKELFVAVKNLNDSYNKKTLLQQEVLKTVARHNELVRRIRYFSKPERYPSHVNLIKKLTTTLMEVKELLAVLVASKEKS